VWRTLTPEDARSLAGLLDAMEAVDRTGEHYDAEDTLQELTDPYVDLERASIAAFDGDRMVAYLMAVYQPAAHEVHRVLLDGGVHPDHRRRGLGAAVIGAGVGAARVLHALHHPTLQLVVEVQVAEQVAGATELLRSQGFSPTRYYEHMEHPLGQAIPEAAIPAGLRVEPWSEHNDDEFRMIRNESFQDHWGSVPMTVDGWRSRMTDHTFRPELSFLLRDGAQGAPAGMLLTKVFEADTAATGVREAHVMLVGTLRDYRRRGVATALLGHALTAAADQDYDRASLRVDSANPSGALGIYVKAGFVPAQRHVRWALALEGGAAVTAG
jgi:mycothiol synthase